MITLTVSKVLPNLTRWEVDNWLPNEKAGYGVAVIALRTPGATDYKITKEIYIRDAASMGGRSDVVGYLAVVSGEIDSQLAVTVGGLSTPTGFTQAHAAFLGATGGRAARLRALEGFLLSSGIANSTLAGT